VTGGVDDVPGSTVLAVDIGGTKLEVGVVDRDGAILGRRRAPTEGVDAAALLATVVDLAEGALADLPPGTTGPRRCGVGCGGPMTAGGETVSPINIPQWRDFPLREALESALGLEVVVDNDAKALALAEGWCGAAKGWRNYLGMVVSTGVGGGVVLDGRLLDGEDGNAGHIGHLIVEPDGARCGCGARGCLEAEASGTAIAAAIGRPASQADAGVIERTGTLVGRAVASVANLLDLRLAVVAGSVALGFGAPFFDAANAEVARRSRLDFSRGTRVVPAGLGGDAPLVGAAAVALRR
jgi:glucokinase